MRSAQIKLSLEKNLSQPPHGWSNPVVPGDHPDPTMVRVGDTFWASSTSGEWSPQFPLFRSTDLVQWTPVGAIFPLQPEWADGAFWAPELVYDERAKRCLAFYVGRERGGTMCIAVASAPEPGGPYTDHGPIVRQDDGAIDPCFARDEEGEPYLIWKEDGNSRGLPTRIWAERLTEDLLRVTGERTELIRDDQAWEAGIVEGPYILQHEGRFYMFYAGNACCGPECKYAEGVARADRLLGPWEKFAENPLIGANRTWRCPGHGAAMHVSSSDGRPERDYLLYHAYSAGGTIYVGREVVLDEITWPAAAEGWPVVNAGGGPGEDDPGAGVDFVDEFETAEIGPSWQWPVNTHPDVTITEGRLTLGIPLDSHMAQNAVEAALLAVPRPASMRYYAAVAMVVPERGDAALWAGLTVVGDPFNTIGIGLRGRTDGAGHDLEVWQRRGATQAVLWSCVAPPGEAIYLCSASAEAERHLEFRYSMDGERWETAGGVYDASELPAWDRGLRIGLMLEGPRGCAVAFERFSLRAGS